MRDRFLLSYGGRPDRVRQRNLLRVAWFDVGSPVPCWIVLCDSVVDCGVREWHVLSCELDGVCRLPGCVVLCESVINCGVPAGLLLRRDWSIGT